MVKKLLMLFALICVGAWAQCTPGFDPILGKITCTLNSGLSGSGSANSIPLFSGSASLGNSNLTQDGTTGQIASARLFSTAPCSVASGVTVTLDFANCDTIIVSALAASVSSLPVTHLKPGAHLTVNWTQNGTGGYTVPLPAGAVGGTFCAVATQASYITTWQFNVAADGATLNGTGCLVTDPNDAGWSITGLMRVSSVTPSNSGISCQGLSSANGLQCIAKDSGGTSHQSETVFGIADPGSDHQYTRYIDQTGIAQRVRPSSADLSDVTNLPTGGMSIIIPGDGATGNHATISFPYGVTLTEVRVLSDTSTSIAVDLKTATYANYPGTMASICSAGTCPSLASATKYDDLSLTSWTKTIAAGTVIQVIVSSTSATANVTVSLAWTRN